MFLVLSGGEIKRSRGRHGVGKVLKFILIGAVPPFIVKVEHNLGCKPFEVFHNIN